MRSRRARRIGPLVAALCLSAPLVDAGRAGDGEPDAEVLYEVRVVPSERAAKVAIHVEQAAGFLRELSFEVDPERSHGFEAPGELRRNGELVWRVPERGGVLRYVTQIDHLRDPAEYDARCTERWALFRGTDLLPPARWRTRKGGGEARARIRFRLPPGWDVVAPFDEIEPRLFRVEQSEQRLDTPRGWMIAGRIRVQRAEIGGTRVALAAPEEHEVRARDRLALLRWTLPELHRILGPRPQRLVIVSAGDPMWRGGLSGPESLYLHAERPLIGSDGTSPLLHELLHVAMGAVSGEDGDWIVEGLAELYSLELLRRSRTVTAAEAAESLDAIREGAQGARTLFVEHARGAARDRAVQVLHALDARIRERTGDEASLDDVLRRLAEDPAPVTTQALRAHAEAVAGGPLEDFFDAQVD